MTTRRTFILQLAAIPGVHRLCIDLADAETPRGIPSVNPIAYHKLFTDGKSRPAVPEGKRIPFGWDYFTIPSSPSGVELKVAKIPGHFDGEIFLRLMVAVDTRDKRSVSVLLAKSGNKIGELPVWYASALQLFECRLDTTLSRLIKEGIRLVLDEGNESIYVTASSGISGSHVFAKPESASSEPSGRGGGGRFSDTFCSYRSLHPFGWMEGCTLDGLLELERSERFPEAGRALENHLKLFLPDDQNLVYENPNTQPSDNRFNNLEAGLPFAVIAEKYPGHPSIKLVTDFCENRIENGRIKSGSFTTEGCYTLAYPLAALAKAAGNKKWYELALIELEERIKHLTDHEAVYQRASVTDSAKGFRNWGRGYTWFLLGLVRTSAILKQDASFSKDPRLSKIREVFIYYANLALKYQQPDHGWSAFLDLPETGFDASATAGLGASLLYGKQIGWLPELPDSRLYAIRQRLEQSLTPDGFLTASCQINRGGEELQKSGYRVISQYVMGLMAHLYAHLK